MTRLFISIFTIGLLFFSTSYASEREVQYTVGGKLYEGYYISPTSLEAPLVVLIHDWDGLTQYEKRRASMLSELGYAVFVVDMFGKGVRPTTLESKKAKTSALYADRQHMRQLLEGAFKAAKREGAHVDNSVMAGYCFGGAVVLDYARSGADMKGFVSFHGGLETPDGQDYSKTRNDILIFHGTADAAVSMDDFAELAEELEANGVSHEMISYSGAPHAFTVFGSTRYRKDADGKSWNRFTQFLAQVLRNEKI